MLNVSEPFGRLPGGRKLEPALFQRSFACLRPVSELRTLELGFCAWTMAASNMLRLAVDHPDLVALHLLLNVSVPPLMARDKHEVEVLHHFPGVRLSLRLQAWRDTGETLAVILRKLQGIQLEALNLLACVWTSAHEAQLAQCSIRHLTMRFMRPDMRLQRTPPGAAVVYDPHNK